MKKIIIIAIIYIFTFTVKAQENVDSINTSNFDTVMLWSNNTVKTLKKGRKEIGIFSPLKFGLKDSIEITVHPIYFLIIPNVEIKKYWKSFGIFELASKHKLSYPTLLYKTISRRGTGGVLPATADIPQMIKINNSLMLGKTINEYFTATISGGVDLTLSFSKGNFPEIEHHLVYPRTYSYNNLFTPYFAVNFTGKFFGNIYYDYDFTMFFMTNVNTGNILENKFKFQWNITDKFAAKAGVLVSYGKYPYGYDRGLFPVFDLMYGF